MVPAPPPLPDNLTWSQLWRELHNDLQQQGAFQRIPAWYIGQSLLVAGLFFVGWVGLLLAPWWPVSLLLAALTGFATVQAGLIGHDAGHKAISVNPRINNIIGQFFFSFLSGYSFDRWVSAHNRHHIKCNEGGEDPDMEIEYLALYPEDVPNKKGLAKLTTRYQHYLIGLAMVAQPYSMIADSVRHMRAEPQKTRIDQLCMVGHVILWGVIPALVLGPIPALVNFMVRNLIIGPYMSSIFLFNHVGAPTLSPGEKLPFIYQQIITSRNLANHWLLNFLTGGLNHQIEHHLFPSAPRLHYSKTRPAVQALCKTHGIPYQEVGYMQASVEVWQHFRAMAALIDTDSAAEPLKAPSAG